MADKDFKVKAGLDLSVPLPVIDGGTGQTTANNALNAMLPAQTTHGSKILGTDGTNTTWVNPGAAYQTSEPNNPVTGQLWVDSDETGDSLDPYIIRRKTITATAGQTVFTTDVVFTDGYEQVYYNGVLLARTGDYTTSGGTNTVTLLQGASAGDTVEIISSTPINLVNSAVLSGGNNFIGGQRITSSQNGNNFIVTAPGGENPNFVIQGDGEQTFRFYNSNLTGTTRTSWKMANRLNPDWSWIWYTDQPANGTNDLTLSNRTGIAAYFSADARAGFGSVSPNSKIEVKDTSKVLDSFGTTFISASDFGVDKGGSISLGGVFTSDNNQSNISPYAQISGRKLNATSGDYAGYMSFGTRANGGGITEKMRITQSGDVGIGKTNPAYKLDVNGTVNSAGTYGPLLGGVSLATVPNSTLFQANVDTKIGDMSPLGDGLFAIWVNWGSADNNAGSQLYWNTSFGGIVGVTSNTVGGYFNGSAANELLMSATQHHRNATTLPRFFLKSDTTNGSYGNLSLYIRFPEITRVDIFTIMGKRLYG